MNLGWMASRIQFTEIYHGKRLNVSRKKPQCFIGKIIIEDYVKSDRPDVLDMVDAPGYPRLMSSVLQDCLCTFGCVNIRGPKGCGKTWLCRSLCGSEILLEGGKGELVALDRSVALDGESPRLIDEWQAVPSLWDDVRFKVDETGKKGQYILCESFSLPDEVCGQRLHSGIGRIYSLDMRPMSLYESHDSIGTVSLMGLFEGEFENQAVEPITMERLISLAVRGGWPDIVAGGKDPIRANRARVKRFCEDGCSEIHGTRRDTDRMMRVIRSFARNESSVVKVPSLISGMRDIDGEGISENTLAGYRSALERMHVLWAQPAFNPCFTSDMRVGKSPKLHLIDPSLSIAALKLNPELLMNSIGTFGTMFEGMCERDLAVYAEAHDATLFHYRDGRGNHIDAIIELPDGRWGAFEIVLGYCEAEVAAESLLRMKRLFEEKGAKVPSVLCVICGVSRIAMKRPDGVYVVPITCLKDRLGSTWFRMVPYHTGRMEMESARPRLSS